MLYEVCPACKGKGYISAHGGIDTIRCMVCELRRVVDSGITLAQVTTMQERLSAMMLGAKLLLRRLVDVSLHRSEPDDVKDGLAIAARMALQMTGSGPLDWSQTGDWWLCKVCQCTDDERPGYFERLGSTRMWVEPNLCSACCVLQWTDPETTPSVG